MKKLITICLLMTITYVVNAQTLRGSCYDDGQGTNSWFTQVDLNATFSFYAKNNLVYIRCSNLRMNVPSNTTYNAYGKTYTKSDLGISQWPQNQKPWSMTINVNGSHNGGNFNKSISCSANFTCDEFHIEGIRADNVNISSFKVNSISNFTYNQGGDPQLEELIKQKNKQESQKTNSSSTASTNSESSNSLDTSQSSTTETTSQIPSLESQYEKLGIPANTPTYTKQEVTNQLVAQGVGLLGNIIGEMSEEKRQKEAEEKERNERYAEYARVRKIEETRIAKENFIKDLDLWSIKAIKGDSNAQLSLIYSFLSKHKSGYSFENLIPLWKNWLSELVQNNNEEAINIMGVIGLNLQNNLRFNDFTSVDETLKILEKSSENGNETATLLLIEFNRNNPKKTLSLLERGLQQESIVATSLLAELYSGNKYLKHTGTKIKVKRDFSKANYLMQKAITFISKMNNNSNVLKIHDSELLKYKNYSFEFKTSVANGDWIKDEIRAFKNTRKTGSGFGYYGSIDSKYGFSWTGVSKHLSMGLDIRGIESLFLDDYYSKHFDGYQNIDPKLVNKYSNQTAEEFFLNTYTGKDLTIKNNSRAALINLSYPLAFPIYVYVGLGYGSRIKTVSSDIGQFYMKIDDEGYETEGGLFIKTGKLGMFRGGISYNKLLNPEITFGYVFHF
jgi:hypothetical protein